MNLKTTAGIATVIAALAGAAVFTAQPAVAQPQGGQGGQPAPQDMGRMLVEGLKSTPGCLGVTTGDTDDGLSFIMAWFENAESARKWYYHPVHVRMTQMAGGVERQAPLEHVTDEDAPVMVIASLRFTDKPEIPNIPIPISQISIELYTPLPGGAMVNGRMAPEAMPIPHMKDYSGEEGEKYGR